MQSIILLVSYLDLGNFIGKSHTKKVGTVRLLGQLTMGWAQWIIHLWALPNGLAHYVLGPMGRLTVGLFLGLLF